MIQLYLPKIQTCNPNNLTRLGLGHLSGNARFANVANGPDGSFGSFAHWDELHPDIETWKPSAANPALGLESGAFFMGWKQKPAPTSMLYATPRLLNSVPVRLADGQDWWFPICSMLPKQYGLNGSSGEFERRVIPKYRTFYEIGQRAAAAICEVLDILEHWMQAHPNQPVRTDLTIQESWEFCCQGLAMNYMLSPDIIDALELLDDDSMRACVAASLELAAVLQTKDQKKTDDFLHIPATCPI